MYGFDYAYETLDATNVNAETFRVPVFGLTAGLPMTLQRLCGLRGHVHGLDHFGYSAPYQVLDEKFGFNAETIYNEVCDYIEKF